MRYEVDLARATGLGLSPHARSYQAPSDAEPQLYALVSSGAQVRGPANEQNPSILEQEAQVTVSSIDWKLRRVDLDLCNLEDEVRVETGRVWPGHADALDIIARKAKRIARRIRAAEKGKEIANAKSA